MKKTCFVSLFSILLTMSFATAQTPPPARVAAARAVARNHPIRSAQARAAARSEIAGVHSVTAHPVSPASTQYRKIQRQEKARELY